MLKTSVVEYTTNKTTAHFYFQLNSCQFISYKISPSVRESEYKRLKLFFHKKLDSSSLLSLVDRNTSLKLIYIMTATFTE